MNQTELKNIIGTTWTRTGHTQN